MTHALGDKVTIRIDRPDRWTVWAVAVLDGQSGTITELGPTHDAKGERVGPSYLVTLDTPGVRPDGYPVKAFWFDGEDLKPA